MKALPEPLAGLHAAAMRAIRRANETRSPADYRHAAELEALCIPLTSPNSPERERFLVITVVLCTRAPEMEDRIRALIVDNAATVSPSCLNALEMLVMATELQVTAMRWAVKMETP